MSPRARRSESITLPPGNHPTLVRYNDDKVHLCPSEKLIDHSDCDYSSESDLDDYPDEGYDLNDSRTSSNSNSMVTISGHGR